MLFTENMSSLIENGTHIELTFEIWMWGEIERIQCIGRVVQ